MHKKILVLPGDGIGPEVTREAVKILEWFNMRRAYRFEMSEGLIGGASIDVTGVPLTDETIMRAKEADSVLLGAVGGPKWASVSEDCRPEQGLLKIRKALALFANLRPAQYFSALAEAAPLKKDRIEELDIIIVRELISDVYFGIPRGIQHINGERAAHNTMFYTTSEIDHITRVAFDLARQRKKIVCSVDKANVLETSMLWRETVQAIRDQDYPDITLSHMYVDNAAMQLICRPKQFDVLLTANLFGDILSDEASVLTGSLGMLPSASIGAAHSLYEPIHGSAPDIAGKGSANPLAAILSVALMFEHTFQLQEEAQHIRNAVTAVLDAGYRTADIMTPGSVLLSTEQMGDQVIAALNN